MDEQERSYFQTLEDGIAQLPIGQQGKVFRQCAVNCVKNIVLPIMQQRFTLCDGDLDSFFSDSYNSEYSFQKVISKGHVYEFGYPKCFCPLYGSGLVRSAIHCECSRQSILFILEELFPNKKFDVEIIETVIGGANQCKFTINVDK